ncbi:MAG: hypothetical protein HY010_10065 [Acidobacteria bacterium]|nr:hypothetical protein [Acidobacteriota bacterium]
MPNPDPAGEWRELSERYRQMSDEELLVLARESSELTDIAQQALTQEISYRKLSIPAPAVPVRSIPKTDPDSPYAKDRELVEISTVWSSADAMRLQAVLDGAGIPFYIGPELATGVEEVTSDFSKGLGVKIMSIGRPWARQAMKNYFPVDEPPSEKEQEDQEEEHPVRCPKCHSTEVVFGELIDELADQPPVQPGATPSDFEWTCDSCGHKWVDDGIVGEA